MLERDPSAHWVPNLRAPHFLPYSEAVSRFKTVGRRSQDDLLNRRRRHPGSRLAGLATKWELKHPPDGPPADARGSSGGTESLQIAAWVGIEAVSEPQGDPEGGPRSVASLPNLISAGCHSPTLEETFPRTNCRILSNSSSEL